VSLVVSYHAKRPRARSFAILVDGVCIADETLPGSGASRFRDVEYPLPTGVLAGKQKVTVRFEATGGRDRGRVRHPAGRRPGAEVSRGLTPQLLGGTHTRAMQ
jgi:hypothetical protein